MEDRDLAREFEKETFLHDLKFEYAKQEDVTTKLAILQVMRHYMEYDDYVEWLQSNVNAWA